MKILWNCLFWGGLGVAISLPLVVLVAEEIHWVNWAWAGIGVTSLLAAIIIKWKLKN